MPATNTVDTKATTVDAEVDTASTVTEVETETTEVEATTVTEATPKSEGFAELQQQAKREAAIRSQLGSTGQCLESNGHYAELGCFYAAPAPVANSFGAELGVVTRDTKAGTVQRTGIGFYIRSDHAADVKFNLCP